MSIKEEKTNMSNFDVKNPHNELPSLPPKCELETKAVLKKCILARTVLEELRQTARRLPGQSVALTNTLPLLEAQASSEIENIVTTTDKLFRHANTSVGADPATKEALRYREALYQGYLDIKKRPLSTNTAETICSKIKNTEMNVRKVAGTALASSVNGSIIYTPPVGENLLRDKLGNWETYLHDDNGIEPLVKMAVAHYQFEAIHPFTDGNGRTGRIINILYLIDQNLLDIPVLYLSRYIIQNKDEYYSLLQEVTTHGHWEPWLLYMLEAVAKTAAWTCEKIKGILRLMKETRIYMQNELPKIYSRELADIIFEQPYCRITDLIEAKIAQRQTASAHLKKLAGADILIETKIGREKLFLNPRYMMLLTSDLNEYPTFE